MNNKEVLSLKNCNICPRNCGVDRTSKNLGFCRQKATLTAARAYLHAWEEPCISGENGSGTVFFSGCNMRCVFCQNQEIASGDVAKEISSERLSEIFLELQEKKASNINLVTPTHFVPLIIPAIESARDQGLVIPVVYNTSGYEKVDTLKALEGLVDIYLPDCKYYSDEIARRYSNAPGYYKVAMAAIEEMIRQVGKPRFYPENYHPFLNAQELQSAKSEKNAEQIVKGISNIALLDAEKYNRCIENADDDYAGPLMKSGVIVRHLMLPGCLEDSKRIIEKILASFGDKCFLSIMNQFTPHGDLSEFPELLKPVDPADYDKLIDFAIEKGIENGFFQGEGTDSESFIPAFDYTGL